jgi:hypothetical protein
VADGGMPCSIMNAKSDTFTPGTTADNPPQGNDAKCGFACHLK